MDKVRGMLMLIAGALAFYRGFMVRSRNDAWLAFGLGVLAIALGVWRLTRKPPGRLV
ncbi:MAG TPA: hypothetical protein VGG85_16130 [Terracidiphilus sp.]|jgi:uncharacterized membrane protein HdeD (DUF308 family)